VSCRWVGRRFLLRGLTRRVDVGEDGGGCASGDGLGENDGGWGDICKLGKKIGCCCCWGRYDGGEGGVHVEVSEIDGRSSHCDCRLRKTELNRNVRNMKCKSA